MKSLNISLLCTLFVLGGLLVSGCVDNLTSAVDSDAFTADTATKETTRSAPLLRNPQLLDAALSKSTPSMGKRKRPKKTSNGKSKGKSKGEKPFTVPETEPVDTPPEPVTPTIVQHDLFVFIGYYGFEANGITPRILDEYSVTNRVLEEYGVTRRVLEDYGITKRVLDDYGITRRVLDDYGITRRVLDDYGITQRLLDEYNLTWEDFEALLNSFEPSIRIRSYTDGGISVWIRGEDVNSILEEMIDDPDIDFVEPDPEAQFVGVMGTTSLTNPADRQYYPWGVDRVMGGLRLESKKKVHVYVLDSGISNNDISVTTFKDFTPLFLNRTQAEHEEDDWIDPGYFDPGNTRDRKDVNGHGTHVAGTLAAQNNKSGIVGVVPGLKINSLKVLTDDGRSDVTTIVAAFNYVIHQRENVHAADEPVLVNLSIGMDIGTTAYNVLDETVQKAIAAGIVVVVAAGNNGKDVSTYSPAHVADAITVGAYDQSNRYAGFSNWGTGIDILAPGTDIVSLSSSGEVDQYLVVRSGTSMAAPHVTAAAALYWAQFPTLSPAEVRNGLLAESDDVVTGAPTGTTTRGIMLDFANDAHISSAAYNRGHIRVSGTGPINSRIELRTGSTNTLFAVAITDTRGDFDFFLIRVQWVPCTLTIPIDRRGLVESVRGAPTDCVE